MVYLGPGGKTECVPKSTEGALDEHILSQDEQNMMPHVSVCTTNQIC